MSAAAPTKKLFFPSKNLYWLRPLSGDKPNGESAEKYQLKTEY